MIIKLILIGLLVIIALFFIRNRNTARLRAGKKLLFLLFIAGGIAAVVQPNLLTKLAHAVGVGRGTDLLLYGLVLAFCFVTLNVYLKFKDYEARLGKLAREIAILEAKRK